MPPVRRSARSSRTPVQNYYQAPTGYTSEDVADEDMDLSLGRARKRIRRVIVDSDDDSEHNGSDAMQPPIGTGARIPLGTPHLGVAAGVEDSAQPQASGFHDLPSPDDPEATADGDFEVNLDELDAYLADYSEEDDVEDVEEEDYVPGPGEDDEEDDDGDSFSPSHDFRPPSPVPSQDLETDGANEKFEQILRKCLDGLVGWAKRQDYKTWTALPRSERAMTNGSWHVLSRTSVDFLMKCTCQPILFRYRTS
jgi:hypothetical protein